jgi:hypothetical protein
VTAVTLTTPLAAIFGGEKMPVVLALLAPLLAAVIVVSFEESPVGRVLSRVAMFVGAAGAGLALARTLMGDRATWQGFVADPWRALLAAGALLVSCAFSSRGTGWSRGAVAVAGAVGSAAIFAPDALWLGILLPATTAAYAVAALTVSEDPAVRLEAMRSTVALVVADLAAVLGLILGASKGLTLPPSSSTAAALLLAAGAIRLGLAPAATEDAVASGLGAAWLGPVRAQGALLAGFAVAAGGARATVLAGLGTAMAVGAAWRAFREHATEPLATVAAGVVAAGLGLGGPVGAAGAVLTLASSFAAWPLWLARRADGAAVPTFAFAPAGATFVGGVMIAGAALQAGAVRAPYLVIAVGLLVAAPLAVLTAWRARDPEWAGETVLLWIQTDDFEVDGDDVDDAEDEAARMVDEGGPPDAAVIATEDDAADHDEWVEGGADVVVVRGGGALRLLGIADALWVVPAILILVALVAQPERVRDFVAVPAAAVLGAGRLLGTDPFGVDDTLGVIMAVLMVLGLAAAGGERAAAAELPSAPPLWGRWWLAPAPVTGSSELVRRWGLVAAVAGAATVGLAARLLLVASSRGFL